MAGKEIAVKKYVVKLSEDERNQLNELIRKGKSSATADQGADLVEGRCLGGRRGMER